MKAKFLVRIFANWFHSWYRNLIRHPKHRWWIIGGTLLYLLGPIDISPDVFPVLGWIDDGVVVTLLVTEVSQLLLTQLKAQKQKESVADANQSSTETVIDVNAVSVS
jgi:uncharacterized membrane protein YkvA (DUF1232 family)